MSIGDIRAGSGLGSSGSFTVGLLNALHAYKGDIITKQDLAEEAYKVEVEILHSPSGKQDQYAASYGGINYIKFTKQGVNVSPIILPYKYHSELSRNLMLFNTKIVKSSNKVLEPISNNMNTIYPKVTEIVNTANEMEYELRQENINLDNFGKLIYSDWLIKKSSGDISSQELDVYINKAMKSGAIGSKLCGAGQGGYILLYCKRENQNDVKKAMYPLEELEFKLDTTGSKIIYE